MTDRASLENIVNSGHILIAGQTGSGKSVLLNNLLYHIVSNSTINQAQFILCDPKRVELYKYSNTYFCDRYACEHNDILSALDHAISIMEYRYEIMQENEQTKYDGSTYYVVIDELADLMVTCRKSVLPKLQRIAQLGRASKVFLMACTQAPSRKVIPAELTLNFNTKIALHCDSPIESKQIIGVPGAESLPQYGQAIVKAVNEKYILSVDIVENETIKEAMARYVRPVIKKEHETKHTNFRDMFRTRRKPTRGTKLAFIACCIIYIVFIGTQLI